MTAKCEEIKFCLFCNFCYSSRLGFAYQILSSQFKGQIILNIEIKSDLKENIDWVLSKLGCPKGG